MTRKDWLLGQASNLEPLRPKAGNSKLTDWFEVMTVSAEVPTLCSVYP